MKTKKTDSKILAVIGAGEGSLPILKKILLLDDVISLAFGLEDSIGRVYADVFMPMDINKIDGIVEKCKDYKVNGIIATSESTTEITAIIANRLGLPGNDVTTGFGARNKYVMRNRVSKLQSVKQPRYYLYAQGNKYKYPVIVKALDSCSKLGISIARNDDEMMESIKYAKKYSKDNRILIEEYLDGGREYSVECLAGNGLYEIVQITEKDSSGPPHFVETGHHQPANLAEDIKRKIMLASTDIMKAVGIKCGLAHLEIKIIDNEVFFIEIGARGGGDHISDILVGLSTGFDYYKAAIDCCLGQYKHQEIHNSAYSGIYFHCNPNKHLKLLFEKARNAKWCIDYSINEETFQEASSNIQVAQSGYIIYKSDHKITLNDALYDV